MPVAGFPDANIHKFCYRCQRWFEPGEGVEMLPKVTKRRTPMLNLINHFSGNTRTLRFFCHRCVRIRKIQKNITKGIAALAILAYLSLKYLQVI